LDFKKTINIDYLGVFIINIIDTHCHLGKSCFTNIETREEELIKAMDINKITACLLIPQVINGDVRPLHNRIAEMSKKFPGRIFGVANMNPWVEDEVFRKEIKSCIEEKKFVALKLNTSGHNISPLSPYCNKIYELADYYQVPVIVHTGLGVPHALPSLVLEPAKNFPRVNFILAHAGFAIYTDEAIVTAINADNVFLEPSWCPTYALEKMINRLGVSRIIMGSDHLSNLPVELVKFKSINLSEHQLEQVFFKNPIQLFKLKLKNISI